MSIRLITLQLCRRILLSYSKILKIGCRGTIRSPSPLSPPSAYPLQLYRTWPGGLGAKISSSGLSTNCHIIPEPSFPMPPRFFQLVHACRKDTLITGLLRGGAWFSRRPLQQQGWTLSSLTPARFYRSPAEKTPASYFRLGNAPLPSFAPNS